MTTTTNIPSQSPSPQMALTSVLAQDSNKKMDAYLLAGLVSGFAEYEFAAHMPTLSIGFTFAVAPNGSPTGEYDKLIQLFAGDAASRICTAHAQAVKHNQPAYVTAMVSLALLLELLKLPQVTEVQLCSGLSTTRPGFVRMTDAKPSTKRPIVKSVKSKILAVIDHGCPFAHRSFITNGQSMLHSIWDQDDLPDFPAADGFTPAGLDYGRVVSGATLTSYINAAKNGLRVDEDKCYRVAQYRAVSSSVTHGSAVMGLLASRYYSPSLSPDGRASLREGVDADVIFVQLPRNIPLAPARGSIERCTLDGIRYVLECAPNNSHVSVVVDYGTEMGPHDGSSWFERALDALVVEALTREVKLDVVFPSGNSHEAKRHAVINLSKVKQNATVDLQWVVPSSNEAALTFEFWCHAVDAQFEFEVAPPNTTKPVISFADTAVDDYKYWTHKGHVVATAVKKIDHGNCQIVFQIAATQANSSTRSAPSGVWTISLKRTNRANTGLVYAYTCWGGRNEGFPQRLWPGKFRAEAAAINNGQVTIDGNGSLMGSACGNSATMAGGYERWGYLERAIYSSGGTSRGGRRLLNATGADYMAATEQSPTLPGLACQGTRSASFVRMSGTSFAAPQIARNQIMATLVIHPPIRRPLATPTYYVTKPRNEYGEPRIV